MIAAPFGWQGRDRRGQEALADLRRRSLGYLLVLTASAYFVWHTLFTATALFEEAVKAWLLFPFVAGGVAACAALRSRQSPLAGPCFTVWGFTCVALATWIFPSPAVLLLYPLLALATAVSMHWSAALIVVLAEAGLAIVAVVASPPSPLSTEQLWLAVLGAGLTTAVVWTLLSGLDVAIAWWLESYDEARRHLDDAREHRGRLVQALAQLDDAYYRLRRTNASLAEAWRAADLAERAKAEFVTSISHELRTPLNLIAGFSEMMLSAPESYGDQPLPREYRGDLHAIYRSAQHLLALTDDVLDLAQAEMSHLALVREPTDLAEVIRGAEELVRDYVETKGLALGLHVAEGLPRVALDALRIRQVLLNLLTNAARYTDYGSIQVSLERFGDRVRVSVADTGRGLTAEQRERVFQEFQHLDPAAAREHRSTGLGLPISKKFIELHGGHMWVESALGKGTTFRFDLPLAAEVDAAPSGLAAPRATPGSTERVLVLDHPDERLRRLLQRGLERYRVFAAADPEQAAQMAFALRATAIIAAGTAAAAPAGVTPRIACQLPVTGSLPGTFGVVAFLTKPIARAALRSAIAHLPSQPRRILIVDDELHAVRLLRRMLKADQPDAAVLAAHNGAEALARMHEERPDLILLDLMMPGCSGQQVLEAMAADAELAETPVIVVSGHAQAEETLQAPGELHLTVPEGFHVRTLMDMLRHVLEALPPPRAYLDTTPPPGATDPADAPV